MLAIVVNSPDPGVRGQPGRRVGTPSRSGGLMGARHQAIGIGVVRTDWYVVRRRC